MVYHGWPPHDLKLQTSCWGLRFDPQTEETNYRRRFEQAERDYAIIIALTVLQYHLKVRTTLGRGGIYTPNLITSFQKCPSGPHEGLEITTGVLGNFPRLDSPT